MNFLDLILSAVIAFAFGGLWYSKLLFSDMWEVASGVDWKTLPSKSLIYVIAFFLTLVSAFAYSYIAGFIGVRILSDYFIFSAILFFGFSLGPLAMHILYTNRSRQLLAIDSGYHFCVLMIFALVNGVL